MDTTQTNFKDGAEWPTAVLVCAAHNLSVSPKVTQRVGKMLNTAIPICNPGEGEASAYTGISMCGEPLSFTSAMS